MSIQKPENKNYRYLKEVILILAGIVTILAFVLQLFKTEQSQTFQGENSKDDFEIELEFNNDVLLEDTVFQISTEKFASFKKQNFIVIVKRDTVLVVPIRKIKGFEIKRLNSVLSLHLKSPLNDVSIVCDGKLNQGPFISYIEDLSNSGYGFEVKAYSINTKMILGMILALIGILTMIGGHGENGCLIKFLGLICFVVGVSLYIPFADY